MKESCFRLLPKYLSREIRRELCLFLWGGFCCCVVGVFFPLLKNRGEFICYIISVWDVASLYCARCGGVNWTPREVSQLALIVKTFLSFLHQAALVSFLVKPVRIRHGFKPPALVEYQLTAIFAEDLLLKSFIIARLFYFIFFFSVQRWHMLCKYLYINTVSLSQTIISYSEI